MKVIHVRKHATEQETVAGGVMLDDFSDIDHIQIKLGVMKIVYKKEV